MTVGVVRQLQAKPADDAALEASFRANAPENARLTFERVAEGLFEEMIEDNFSFYKHVTDDPAMKGRFFDWLFEQYLGEREEEQEGDRHLGKWRLYGKTRGR